MKQINQHIKRFYIPYKKLGFDYKCVEHNHLNNKDVTMVIHLFQQHDILVQPDNWRELYFANELYYDCRICEYRTILNSDMKEHIKGHGFDIS